MQKLLLLPLLFATTQSIDEDGFLRLKSKGSTDFDGLKNQVLDRSRSSEQLTGKEFFIYKAIFESKRNENQLPTLLPRVLNLPDALFFFTSVPENDRDFRIKSNDLKVFVNEDRLIETSWKKLQLREGDCAAGYLGQSIFFDPENQFENYEKLIDEIENVTFIDGSYSELKTPTNGNKVTIPVEKVIDPPVDIACAEPLYWTSDPIDLVIFVEILTAGWQNYSKVMIPVGSVSENVMKVLEFYEKEDKVIILPAPIFPFTDEMNRNLNTSFNALFQSYCAILTKKIGSSHIVTNGFGYSMEKSAMNFHRKLKGSLKIDEGRIDFTPINASSPVSITGEPGEIVEEEQIFARILTAIRENKSANQILKSVVETLPKIFPDQVLSLTDTVYIIDSNGSCSNPILSRFDDFISNDDWVFAQPSAKSKWSIL